MMNKEENMTQEDKEYLLSIASPEGSSEGVKNLNDEAEISRKLEEVERDNTEYRDAIDTGKSIELLSREDIVNWLFAEPRSLSGLSLGD